MNFQPLLKNKMKSLSYVVVMVFCISACSTAIPVKPYLLDTTKSKIPLPPYLKGSFFGSETIVVSNDEVYQLSAVQQKHFLDYFHKPARQSLEPIQRVYEYLEQRLDNFNYFSDTFTASEALFRNSGNCLSLAILTKSLADLARVDINYQLIETEPVYQQSANIIVSSQHIRTVLFRPHKNVDGIHFFAKRTYIDYFPTYNSRVLRRVDESEFFSMYYANKSVEAMLKNDYNLAYWTIRKALDLKPDDSNALNIMAIIHSKLGHSDSAEELYLFGIKYASKNRKAKEEQQYLDLLDNYHSLLKRQKRFEEAKLIAEQIGQRNTVNPFKWISLGNDAFNHRDYSKAIKYYRKAVKLAPYLHEAYGGIARAQFQLGNSSSANRSLVNALNNSHDERVQEMYQKKIDMLKQLISNSSPVLIKSEQ